MCGSKITTDQILKDTGVRSPIQARSTPAVRQLDIESAPATLIFERTFMTLLLPALLLFAASRLYSLF